MAFLLQSWSVVYATQWVNPSRSQTTSSKTNFRNNRKSRHRGVPAWSCDSLVKIKKKKKNLAEGKHTFHLLHPPALGMNTLKGQSWWRAGALRERLQQVNSLSPVSTPPFPPLPSCPEFPVQGCRMGGLICVTSSAEAAAKHLCPFSPSGSAPSSAGFPGRVALFPSLSSPISEPRPDVDSFPCTSHFTATSLSPFVTWGVIRVPALREPLEEWEEFSATWGLAQRLACGPPCGCSLLLPLLLLFHWILQEAQENPDYRQVPKELKKQKQFSNKSMVLECLKLRLFIIRRWNMNEKQAITGPADGEPWQDAHELQLRDHPTESGTQPSGF